MAISIPASEITELENIRSTLLIPVHAGREEYLRELLSSLAHAQRSTCYPSEVLIVTSDLENIHTIVGPALSNLQIPARCRFYPEAKTLSALRNKGTIAVETEWVHSVDSDTLIPSDYFIALERGMATCPPSIQWVQLNFRPKTEAFWAYCEGVIDSLVLSRYITVKGVGGFNGMNFLARREALILSGGFAEDQPSAEDIELGYRFHKQGIAALFLPDVMIQHCYPKEFSVLLRRKFWHGKGYALVFRRCPDLHRSLPGDYGIFLAHAKALLHPAFYFYYIASSIAFFSGVIYGRAGQQHHVWPMEHKRTLPS